MPIQDLATEIKKNRQDEYLKNSAHITFLSLCNRSASTKAKRSLSENLVLDAITVKISEIIKPVTKSTEDDAQVMKNS